MPPLLSIDIQGFAGIILGREKQMDRNEVMPFLERRAKRIRKKYLDSGFKFRGGRFQIQVGLIGILYVHMNSDAEIMKIETPEGAYLEP